MATVDGQPQYEWVQVVEPVDARGRPQMPPNVLAATAPVVYDAKVHTDLMLYLRVGAGPEGEIIGQYKVYSVSKLAMKGVRLGAVATVALPASRGHEAEWFEAYEGASVKLSDPGVAGSISEDYSMKVVGTRFGRTAPAGTSAAAGGGYGFEGTLVLRESVWSAVKRHKVKVILIVLGTALTSVVGSLVAVGIGAIF